MTFIKKLSDKLQQTSTSIVFRGSVRNAELLPSSPLTGDMYNIEEKSIYGEAGMNVAWTGTAWDALGPAINMGDYIRVDSKVFTDLHETVSKCLIMLN